MAYVRNGEKEQNLLKTSNVVMYTLDVSTTTVAIRSPSWFITIAYMLYFFSLLFLEETVPLGVGRIDVSRPMYRRFSTIHCCVCLF